MRNISLRHNRISATGAVAIALMIKDYPDRYPVTSSNGNSVPSSPVSTSPSASTLFPSPPQTPTLSSNTALPSVNGVLPPPQRIGPLPPPPRHPSTAPQTTYTPYIPRVRRGAAAPAAPNPLSSTGQQIPIITSSAQGGITTRHPVPPPPSSSPLPGSTGGQGHHGPSAALLDKVRALDALPRLGALRTLDLRGNDIRVRVTLFHCELTALISACRMVSPILHKCSSGIERSRCSI